MLKLRTDPSRLARRQRGLSLVELMVGVAVGLFIVAGGATLVGTQLGENRRLLMETQVHQDLRSSADIIARELRRAGHIGNADGLVVWSPTNDPAPNLRAEALASGADNVDFDYFRGPDTPGPFGFKLEGNAIKTKLTGNNWQELTDPRTVKILEFTITPRNTPEVVIPCPKLCADATENCFPRTRVREFELILRGQAVSDPSIVRRLATNVRLRNDHIKFNDPLNPTRICPL